MLNNVWHNALRALVGAPPWTSGSALRWELGIPFSGAAKAIAQALEANCSEKEKKTFEKLLAKLLKHQ